MSRWRFVIVGSLLGCAEAPGPGEVDEELPVLDAAVDRPVDRARADALVTDAAAAVRQAGADRGEVGEGVVDGAADTPDAMAQPGDGGGSADAGAGAFGIAASEIEAVGRRVADWQLANPSGRALTHWVPAAFYVGVMSFAEAVNEPRYRDAMRSMSERTRWQPGPRMRHADDHAVTQTYLELFLLDRRPPQVAPTLALFDELVTLPYRESLAWGGGIETREWAWCDALFMAPPALALATHATGDRKYVDLMHRLWWKTTNYLLDDRESLYYRDSRFFGRRTQNGQKVFWSRGNGWVFAGLARVLRYLPPDYPERGRYETLFRRMAARLLMLQKPDGYWPSSLLDRQDPPGPETSGTGFFTFGLAWGANNGLLDPAAVAPAVQRGWEALARAVQGSGRLGYVQPVGFDPQPATANSSEPYGAGALLLAAGELLRWGTR